MEETEARHLMWEREEGVKTRQLEEQEVVAGESGTSRDGTSYEAADEGGFLGVSAE